MAISEVSGIPYGSINTQTGKHTSVSTIESDGRVDDAFVKQGGSFLSDIRDPRIKAFVQSNASPGPDWHAREMGGYDSEAGQSLFVKSTFEGGGVVVLRTTLEEQGDRVSHHIEAPFNAQSCNVSLQDASEGFNIARGQRR
ncbi:hypothetical protein IV102_29745 [bacterium]|nr:hypothetical protein [bacterium]